MNAPTRHAALLALASVATYVLQALVPILRDPYLVVLVQAGCIAVLAFVTSLVPEYGFQWPRTGGSATAGPDPYRTA